MDPASFNRIRSIVCERSGIDIREGKQAMVSARVGKRMRTLGMSSVREYLRYLEKAEQGDEVTHLIDVISTNVTSFFRQPEQFEFIGRVAASWAAAGQHRLRFWCAACATGEEPYSLATTLLEALRSYLPLDLRILATDISTEVLEQCLAACYPEESVRAVPLAFKERYFFRREQDGAVQYHLKGYVKQIVLVRHLNLSRLPYPLRGPLDAIFCRNVMIYFSKELCRRILVEIHRLLKPNGFLVTGHAEGLTSMLSSFRPIRPAIYIKEQ